MTRPSPELARDHALVIDAVREAGAMAMTYFGGDVESWEKAPGNPVSDADIAVDNLLADRLCRERPAYGWLSEETEDDPARLSTPLVWIVDPIDGTRAFLKGRPEFTVCAALVADGAPILGVVFNPATGDFFEALKGGGARHNGHQISVTTQRSATRSGTPYQARSDTAASNVPVRSTTPKPPGNATTWLTSDTSRSVS